MCGTPLKTLHIWAMLDAKHIIFCPIVLCRLVQFCVPRVVANTLTMQIERVIVRAHPYLDMLHGPCLGLSDSCICLIGVLAFGN